jgi:hypothetical protein
MFVSGSLVWSIILISNTFGHSFPVTANQKQTTKYIKLIVWSITLISHTFDYSFPFVHQQVPHHRDDKFNPASAKVGNIPWSSQKCKVTIHSNCWKFLKMWHQMKAISFIVSLPLQAESVKLMPSHCHVKVKTQSNQIKFTHQIVWRSYCPRQCHSAHQSSVLQAEVCQQRVVVSQQQTL